MTTPGITPEDLAEGERLHAASSATGAARKSQEAWDEWAFACAAWDEWAFTRAPALLAEIRRLLAALAEEKRGRCTCCGGYATPNKCSGCYDGEHFPACGIGETQGGQQ